MRLLLATLLLQFVFLFTSANGHASRLVGFVNEELRDGVAGCQTAAAPCGPGFVERTIMVPQLVTETRTIKVLECRPVARTETITVMKPVVEHRQQQQTHTVLRYETRTRTEKYVVAKPVMETIDQTCTVLTPHQERRTGVRIVCRPTAVTEQRAICEDQGHWEERPVSTVCRPPICRGCKPSDCVSVAPPTCVCRHWVSKIVTKQIPITVVKPQMVEEPYEYVATVCRPEVRHRTITACRLVMEPHTRQVAYTACVPTQEIRMCDVAVVRYVPEKREVCRTAMIPHEVEKQIQVQVCRMVPKTIRIPECAAAPIDCGAVSCGPIGRLGRCW